MRKFILSACLFILSISTFAVPAKLKFTDGDKHIVLTKKTGNETITVIIFDSITNRTTIDYDGTNVSFYKYANAITNYKPETPTLYPVDNTGYIIKVDGDITDTIWVISYKNNLPTSIAPSTNQSDQCKGTNLDVIMPQLYYKTPDSGQLPISRDCKITYNTLTWGGSNWNTQDTTITKTFPQANPISVPAPYCNTAFTLTGDQFATKLGIPFNIPSPEYPAVAVICHETSQVLTRGTNNDQNEVEGPTNLTDVSSSAPLEITFYANANVKDITTMKYKWEIFKNDSITTPSLVTDRTDPSTSYIFKESGTYYVKVTVSDDYGCTYSNVITVTVTDSYIKAPSIFTPNGDGINDEFRVKYHSIMSFQAWVYNRWGRLVYHWTDPQKGWDGNINGRKAAIGAYFYVIKALGNDFDAKAKPNKTSHLRPGEYLLKGDINILR